MSRRRNIKFLSVLASASLIVAASCSGDDDDGAISEGTSPEGTSAGTETEGTDLAPPEDTEADTTEPEGTAAEGEGEAPAGAEDVGVEGGSACGIPHGPWEDTGEPAGEVRVAWNDPMLSYNARTSRGNAVANNNPLYLMGLGNYSGFSYYDQDLNYINNDQFGTCTLDSLDPLTVTYRINEGVTWSDGTPMDAADMLLEWAGGSEVFNDADPVIAPDGTTAEADADGNPIIVDASGAEVPAEQAVDPETEELLEGYTYKESTGVLFDSVNESFRLITQVPVVSDDGQAVTATWDQFFVDYQTNPFAVNVPAHVVAKYALGVEDPTEGKQAIVDAITSNDRAALKEIADFYNTGFDFTSLPAEEDLYLSAGQYLMTSYDELSQLTFEANPDYTWGPRPKVQTIVYRIIGEPTAAVQALENEEIDMILPQSTADILTQVEALADRGVEVETGNGATYEHVDLVVNNGGPFDPATYGGDAETALKVRQAFLKTIPRQEIVDRLIVPLNPEAELRDSFTTVPGAPTYEALVAENGSAEYAEVDIEGATALLEEAGVTTPLDVRFLFAANNPRRASEYELIRDSAAQAGFNVIDGNSPTWTTDRENPSLYDASLFGWQSTAVAVADTESNFRTAGQNNPHGYSNATVDSLYDELKGTTDAAAQQELLVQIEQQLWSDAFGVTIFQFPEILAYNSTYVSNVSSIPLSPQMFWNFWEWEAA